VFKADKTSGCSPFDVVFTNQTVNAESYNWDFGDGNVSTNTNANHTYINNSNTPENRDVTLQATSSYGCSSKTIPTTVSISPRINAAFSVNQTSGCSPVAISFTNNTVNATQYSWNFGDGTTSTNAVPSAHDFTNSSAAAKTYDIILTASSIANCSATSKQTVNIYPSLTLNILPDTAGCSPFTVNFTDNSTNAVNFDWDFGDGQFSNLKTPSNTFVNETENNKTVTVTARATSHFGCTKSDAAQITIYATPNSDFTLNTSYLELPTKTVQISNLTKGLWQTSWDFGDGQISNAVNPLTHDYTDTGSYKIMLTNKSAHCTDTISHTVIVSFAQVLADYDSSFWGCAPLTVSFINKSKNATAYQWDFGDGTRSNETTPTHRYETSGTYVVELNATNGGLQNSSRAHTVSVYDVPLVDFEVAPTVVYLPNANVRYYNKSKYGQSWLWDFGDGDTSALSEPSHTYNNIGVYDVELWGWNIHGCHDSLLVPKAVTVLKDCSLIFPNAFTPTDIETGGKYLPDVPETTNNIFHPIFRNIETYHLEIFNRWGELIFASDAIDIGWDGYYKGTLSKQDVYVWKVEATCYGGKKIKKIGNVTLLR
jgi:gliding motility-associated-like protein